MRGGRVTKLERRVHSRPCAGCGQPFHPPGAYARADWSRLNPAERAELEAMIAAASTPACGRCGRCGYDVKGMTRQAKHRALQLLRQVYARSQPWLGDFCDADAAGLDVA